MSARDFTIYFTKQDGDCSNVEVWIHTGTDVERPYYVTRIDAGTPILAEVLAGHLSELLGKTMERIRELNYEKGWRDAKAKRTKKSWFSCRLLRKDDE